jgi:hypothetical protein
MPPLFIEVPVSSQESERTCICILWGPRLPISMILMFDFRNVLTAWYFLFCILVTIKSGGIRLVGGFFYERISK